MNIKTFMEEIANAIKNKHAGLEAIPTETQRANGIIQYGLTLRKEDSRVAPVFYVNDMFDKYNSGELSVEAILAQIMRTYEELPAPNIPNVDKMMSSEDFIDKITLRLLNGPENMDMIEQKQLVCYEVPNTDLVCIFHAVIMMAEDSSGSIAVTKALMNRYLPNIKTGEDLYQEIVKRTTPESIRMESIMEVVERMVIEKALALPPIPNEEDLFYVITNRHMSYGAASPLTEAGRKLILEKFPDGKVTILPSSVHESLILRTKEDEDTEMLRDMVCQVNQTEVAHCDFLSNNIYHYDANTGILELVERGEK